MPLTAKHLTVPVSIIAGVGAALVTSAVAQSGGARSPQELSPFSKSAVVALTASLNGPDELRTGPGANETGHPTATGGVLITINPTTNEVCANFTPSADLLDYVAFHIHQGDSTIRNGPIVVDFATGAKIGPFSKCVVDADAPAIVNNPAGYYFNVHTTDFPNGAISGQLARVTETNLLLAPIRVYDTRFNGAGKFTASTTRTIDLTASGIPVAARAAIVTVTVTQADGAGFLTVYSSAITNAPNTSNLNFTTGEDIANNITVATDGTNKIKITSGTEAVSEHVVVDVVGYVL